jgi:hypothetical protein
MTGLDPDRFLRVLRGLLRPLVRTLIARGVPAPAFYRLLKSVYVEVAETSFRLDDKPPTDSRISVLTGVHRRDVRAYREAGPDGWEDARQRAATFATVISEWRARGAQPLDKAQFDALVASISQDVRPRTILDELRNQALVSEAADGSLSLTDAARAGPTGEDQREVFFAANVGDHLAAAAGNLLAEEPRYLERAVFYTRLTPAALDAIEAEARKLGQSSLERLDELSRDAQNAGRDDPENTERYRFGVYFYRERPLDAETKEE